MGYDYCSCEKVSMAVVALTGMMNIHFFKRFFVKMFYSLFQRSGL